MPEHFCQIAVGEGVLFATCFLQDSTIVRHVPTIEFEGTSLLLATQMHVRLENVQVPEKTLSGALTTLLCLYWVFDIVFCTNAQKTFDLLCRLLGLHSGVKATPLVRIAHTMLK